MKTLILFPLNRDFAFNTSAAAVAGVARHHGFECEVYPIEDGQRVERVLEKVLAYDPDIVCATMMTRDILGFRTLFPLIKKHSKAFTAIGGYHTTVRPRQVAEWAGIDAIGIGEGERAILALLRTHAQGRRIATIPGLWVRSAGRFVDPIPVADPELDIADLPPWDYSIVSSPLIQAEAGRSFLPTRTSRTCPFACHYCTVPAWEATNGLRNKKFVNVRTVQHLCRELARLRDQYHPTDIEFWDPQFPFANDWLEELAARFPVEVGLPFRALMHPKTLNQERIQLLAQAGCTQLYHGLESGDVDFRKTVLNKACSDDDIVRTIAWVKDAGIRASAFLMWNMPGETRSQAEKTIEMVQTIGFDQIRVNGYIPLPGTVLGDPSTVEFPDEPVETFEPLPEWRDDRHQNRSAMSDADYRIMFAEFAKLHDRYAAQGDAARLGERDQWTAALDAGDAGARDSLDDHAKRPVAPAFDASHRMPAERLQRLSAMLGFADSGGSPPAFRLEDGFAQPGALTLVLVDSDGNEQKIILRPPAGNDHFYLRTEHCLISYEGTHCSKPFSEMLESIRERIGEVPFEEL